MSLRDERGFTLLELLIVMAVAIVVLSATLLTFTTLQGSARDNNIRLETTEVAREALDVQARQLRNLAKRLNHTPVLDTVAPFDLIFQTSDPNRTWVRYCLDTTNPPATPGQARLWTQERSLVSSAPSPVSAGMRSGCPSSSPDWTTTRVVADQLTNRAGGVDRPLFQYRCTVGTACLADPATYDQVVNVSAQAFVDTDPHSAVPELRVATGINLRNQNQPPIATFVATPASATRTVVLNASGSTDWEGRTLTFYWFKRVMPALTSIDCANPSVTGVAPLRTLWGAAGYLGESITLSHTFTTAEALAGLPVNIGLVVCDPGDRFGTAGITSPIPVQIPS